MATGLTLGGIHLAKNELSKSTIRKMDKKLSSYEEKDIDDDDFWYKSYKIMQKAEKN